MHMIVVANPDYPFLDKVSFSFLISSQILVHVHVLSLSLSLSLSYFINFYFKMLSLCLNFYIIPDTESAAASVHLWIFGL